MTCLKLLIDTNILIDVLKDRAEYVENSAKIWKLCESGQTEGIISSLSVANIVYIMRRQLDPRKTKALVTGLSQIFDIADLRSSDIKAAAELCRADYEDALQICCAERIGADYIITRNIKDFKDSPVPACEPWEFLEKFYI